MTVFNLAITPIFDAAQVGDFKTVIIKLSVMFVWYIAIRLLDYYTELSGVFAINSIRKDIKQNLFSAVIHKQLPDYAERNAGEYIAEFTNDITMIEQKFLFPCKEAVTYIITIVTTGVAIFTIDFRMSLVIIFGVIMCLALPVILTKYTSRRMMSFILRFDDFVQHLKDVFGAFFTFKNYAVEDKIIDNFYDENAEVEKLKYKAEFSLVAMNNLVGRLAWSIEILVVVIGLFGVMRGSLSIGSVFSAYLLAGNLGIPLQSLGHRIGMMRSIRGIEKKFEGLSALDKKIKQNKNFTPDEAGFDIVIDDVTLKLRDNTVLQNVSFTFENGKKYLIVGSNGSGKSTTAKLLKNNYRNYDGRVILGEYDMQSPEGVALTRCISYSNETISLITDTVRNNILLYRDVSDERFEQAIKMAELSIDPERTVGDGGRFLSSGERRKLEIARALIDDPKVLIFDEVVSTLDIETAYEIEKLALSLNPTVIMISNAFSGKLLPEYDCIIMMNKGRVIATGTHSELLESCSEYKEMCSIRCSAV